MRDFNRLILFLALTVTMALTACPSSGGGDDDDDTTTNSFCGDGVVDEGEVCDDGAQTGTGEGFCVPGCTGRQVCGDQIVNGTENCDDGPANGTGEGYCTADCSAIQRCGDRLVVGSEVCDQTTSRPCTTAEGYDGQEECAEDCTAWLECESAFSCGDGRVDGDEVCDVGHPVDCVTEAGYDGEATCKPDCTGGGVCNTLEECGDGITNGPEACDGDFNVDCTVDGAYAGRQNCLADCSGFTECEALEFCGDGIINGNETCDDGLACNNVVIGVSPGTPCTADAECAGIGDGLCLPRGGDGCSANCGDETGDAICGNGEIEGIEVCDDGLNNGKFGYCFTDCAGYPAPVAPIASLGHVRPDGSVDLTRRGWNNLGADSLSRPRKPLYDANRNLLFVSDNGNNRILVYELNEQNRLVDGVADYVLGKPDTETTFAPRTPGAALMREPTGMALDVTHGWLIACDTAYNRILVFDLNNLATGMDASLVLGQEDFEETAADLGNDKLDSPEGVFLDGNDLWVADTGNNRVLRFDWSSPATGMAANAVLGQSNFNSNAAGTSNKIMTGPTAITRIGDILYVSDLNHRIIGYDTVNVLNGEAASYYWGQNGFNSADPGDGPDRVSTPLDILAVGTDLWIADHDNNRVIKVDAQNPASLTDLSRVLGQANPFDTARNTDQRGLWGPSGLAYNGEVLMVADTWNHRVIGFEINGLFINKPDAVEMAGHPGVGGQDYTANGDNGRSGGTFATPSGIAYSDYVDRVFVADWSNGRILAFPIEAATLLPSSNYASEIFGAGNPMDFGSLLNITHLAGREQVFFAAEGGKDRINIYNFFNFTDNMIPSGYLGKPDASTTGTSPTQSNTGGTCGVARVGNRIIASDEENNRVLVWSNVTASSAGKNAENVLGQPNFTTNVEGNGSAQMSFPCGIAGSTTTDRLFVADRGNNRILVFDIDSYSNGESAINVLCQPDFSSTADGTTASTCDAPWDVALDGNYLYVADGINDRVLVFDVSTIENGEDAVFAYGTNLFDQRGAGTTAETSLNAPHAVEVIGDYLWVADNQNHRIMIYPKYENIP